MKQCTKCKQDKSKEDFHTAYYYHGRPYFDGMCKKCRNKSRREYYRKWYLTNGRNRNSDYSDVIMAWKLEHPEAVKAHSVFTRAKRSGLLTKPEQCESCKGKRKLAAHHPDYSKPLNVVWLCYSCHKLRHVID